MRSIPIALGLLAVSVALAEEPAKPDAHGGAEGRHHFRNKLAIVAGTTWEGEEGEFLLTVGAEYARSITPRVRTAFIVEHLDKVDAWVFVAPVLIAPWCNLKLNLRVGPGFEHKSRRGPDTEGSHAENLFLWRLGVGYNFHPTPRVGLTLALDYDFVREDGRWVNAAVFGLAASWNF